MLTILGITAVIIILDQATKWTAFQHLLGRDPVAVAPFLNFTLVFNRGAAFGFLNDAGNWQNFFFVIVALIACFVIVRVLIRLEWRSSTVAVALALILGGAIGNVIDRLVRGYVIDFIDVYYHGWHWPAFNVADSAITIGALLLIVQVLPSVRK